jgi:hypothetical protein
MTLASAQARRIERVRLPSRCAERSQQEKDRNRHLRPFQAKGPTFAAE